VCASVCFFVLCNRHWFNRVPARTELGIACLPVHPCSDAGYANIPSGLTLLGAPVSFGARLRISRFALSTLTKWKRLRKGVVKSVKPAHLNLIPARGRKEHPRGCCALLFSFRFQRWPVFRQQDLSIFEKTLWRKDLVEFQNYSRMEAGKPNRNVIKPPDFALILPLVSLILCRMF